MADNVTTTPVFVRAILVEIVPLLHIARLLAYDDGGGGGDDIVSV